MIIALELLIEIKKNLQDREMAQKVEQWITQLEEFILDGYLLLKTYETTTKGYEWFGQSPGHEALSAYGLNEFRDMQNVVNFVD